MVISASGGGIYNNYGTLTLNNCTLSGNSVNTIGGASSGGGIFNIAGTVTLNQCTVSGNYATSGYGANSFGGGIYNQSGTLALNQCTLSENSSPDAGFGGGICNFAGDVTLNQCTLSGNYAVWGGGINNNHGGTATLNQCTLSGNSALDAGGGIENEVGTATVTITNSIVAGNSGGVGSDIANSRTLNYGGSNLVQSIENTRHDYRPRSPHQRTQPRPARQLRRANADDAALARFARH